MIGGNIYFFKHQLRCLIALIPRKNFGISEEASGIKWNVFCSYCIVINGLVCTIWFFYDRGLYEMVASWILVFSRVVNRYFFNHMCTCWMVFHFAYLALSFPYNFLHVFWLPKCVFSWLTSLVYVITVFIINVLYICVCFAFAFSFWKDFEVITDVWFNTNVN